MSNDNQRDASTSQLSVTQETSQFKMRHPLVALVWGIGLLIAMNLPNYLGNAIGAWMGGLTFDQVISGKAGNLLSHLGRGLTAAIIGIPLGLLMAWFRWIDRLVTPAFEAVRFVAPIAWVPFAALWFGTGIGGPVLIIFMGAFPPVLINTYRGAKIELPSGHVPLSVKPIGNYGWFGGKAEPADCSVVLMIH